MNQKDKEGKLFGDISAGTSELRLATDQQVSEAEAHLGSAFPPGYREYVTTLGEGEYSAAIKVLMPADVLLNLKDYRSIVDEYWFWDEGINVLTKAQALNAIQVAESHFGDILIFIPGETIRMYALPRDSQEIFPAGSNLAEALEWMRTSPVLGLDATERDFKSTASIEMERRTRLQAAERLVEQIRASAPSEESQELSVSTKSSRRLSQRTRGSEKR